MPNTFVCPKCSNDNQSMFDTWNHRRHQVDVNCQICGHDYVHIFEGIPPEKVIPEGVLKSVKRREL